MGKYSFSQALEFAEGGNQKELSKIIDDKMKGKQSLVAVSAKGEEDKKDDDKKDEKPAKAVAMNHAEPLDYEDTSG